MSDSENDRCLAMYDVISDVKNWCGSNVFEYRRWWSSHEVSLNELTVVMFSCRVCHGVFLSCLSTVHMEQLGVCDRVI